MHCCIAGKSPESSNRIGYCYTYYHQWIPHYNSNAYHWYRIDSHHMHKAPRQAQSSQRRTDSWSTQYCLLSSSKAPGKPCMMQGQYCSYTSPPRTPCTSRRYDPCTPRCTGSPPAPRCLQGSWNQLGSLCKCLPPSTCRRRRRCSSWAPASAREAVRTARACSGAPCRVWSNIVKGLKHASCSGLSRLSCSWEARKAREEEDLEVSVQSARNKKTYFSRVGLPRRCARSHCLSIPRFLDLRASLIFAPTWDGAGA
jgi:hypothetical protein